MSPRSLALLLCLLSATAAFAKDRDDAPGDQTRTLNVQGYYRPFVLHVPPAYDGKTPLPLVLVFHGAGGNGRAVLRLTGWARRADAAAFLVAAPDALPLRPDEPPSDDNPPLWNEGGSGTSVEFPPQSHPFDHKPLLSGAAPPDDVAFVKAILQDVTQHFAVDPHRVYATGFSNGAGLTFRLAVTLPDRFAAVAPVSGLFGVANAHPARPVPLLFLIGLDDPIFPFKGGMVTMDGQPVARPPVMGTLANWARAEGYATAAGVTFRVVQQHTDPVAGDGITILSCGPAATETLIYLVAGMGHTWPGAAVALPRDLGPATSKVNGVDLLWGFFQRHSLP